jgi:hypothetical protein
MLKTYKGPFSEGVELVISGRSFGVVKPGESVVIPDELAAKVVFPESIWEDGPAAQGKGSK